MAQQPAPLIETIFKFLGLDEELERVKEFGKSAQDALDSLGKTGEAVSKGLGKVTDVFKTDIGSKVGKAVKAAVGPNSLGSGTFSVFTGTLGLVGKAAEAAFYPVKKLWDVIKGVGGFAWKGLKLGYEGLKKIGEFGFEAGKFFVANLTKAVAAGGAVATALTTHIVTAANRIAGIGSQADFSGVSPEQFSFLKGVIGDADKASKGLRSFRDAAAAALENPASEQGNLFAFFQKFGLQLTDETGQLRDSFDLLKQIREVFSAGIFTPTQEGLLASQLFGKDGGGAFLQVLHKSSEEWNSAARDAIESGNLITGSQVSLAKKVKSAWGSIWDNVEGIGNKLFTSVGGTFADLMTAIGNKIKDSGDGIVEVLSKVSYYLIGFGADLTALAFRSDRDGYNFIHPWMKNLAALRDKMLDFFAIVRGDRSARVANPELAKVVDTVQNDLLPRLKAIGGGLLGFFEKAVLPVFVIVTAAIQGLLPLFDWVGTRLGGMGNGVQHFFEQFSILVTKGPGAVSDDWPWLKKFGERFDSLKIKAHDAWEYVKGVWKTAGDWMTVNSIAKKEGVVGLQKHAEAGDLPKLDPKFQWVTKALTTLQSLYEKTTGFIVDSYRGISETLGPHVDQIKTLLSAAGSWLLSFVDNLATFINGGNVEKSFKWIPGTVSAMGNLVQYMSQAYGFMTALAAQFSNFVSLGMKGVDDERFQGFFQFLEVIKRAFGTMNSIVKDIGGALGLSGIQSQVALIALTFTNLGKTMTKIFIGVGAAITKYVIGKLAKAIGLKAVSGLPAGVLAALGATAGGMALGDLIFQTGREAFSKDGKLINAPKTVGNHILSISETMFKALIPQKYIDEFNGVDRDHDFDKEASGARDAYEYSTGKRQVEMNEDEDLDANTPFSQRPLGLTIGNEPTSIVQVNIDNRRRATVPTTPIGADELAAALRELNLNDQANSLRAEPVTGY